MKPFLILLSFIFSISAFAQSEIGFANKAEAKNELNKDSLKEGKWIEYLGDDNDVVPDTSAPFYRLTIYKADEPYGVVKVFFKSGKLNFYIPYLYGKINGVQKSYYESGKLWTESPYSKGEENGIEKDYY
jgi:antitoxin component YwqK of YwqJK toxin-antitoxin module